jgi:serine/threonine protein kinase
MRYSFDVSPFSVVGNILLKLDDERGWMVKLCDFGVTKELQNTGDSTHHLAGSRAFMAPEMWAPPITFTQSADMWSVGVVAIALLSMATCPEVLQVVEKRRTSSDETEEEMHDSLLVFALWQCLRREPTNRATAPAAIDMLLRVASDPQSVLSGGSNSDWGGSWEEWQKDFGNLDQTPWSFGGRPGRFSTSFDEASLV